MTTQTTHSPSSTTRRPSRRAGRASGSSSACCGTTLATCSGRWGSCSSTSSSATAKARTTRPTDRHTTHARDRSVWVGVLLLLYVSLRAAPRLASIDPTCQQHTQTNTNHIQKNTRLANTLNPTPPPKKKNTATAGTQYSALRQLRPMFRLAPRRPFPPVENPWAYVRASQADVEFSMTKCVRVYGGKGKMWKGREGRHGLSRVSLPPFGWARSIDLTARRQPTLPRAFFPLLLHPLTPKIRAPPHQVPCRRRLRRRLPGLSPGQRHQLLLRPHLGPRAGRRGPGGVHWWVNG